MGQSRESRWELDTEQVQALLSSMLGFVKVDQALVTSRKEAVSNLLARPWFSRAWVVQGAVLPRVAGVLIGPNLVDIYDVHRGSSLVVGITDDIPAGLHTLSATIRKRDALHRGTQAVAFHILLSETGGDCEASDPRDTVYAYLGL